MGRAEELFEQLVNGGAQTIGQFVATEVTEELFLDYKNSSDLGAGLRLHDNDRKLLAKAISGFGNSEGGVIVWGVDCREVKGRGDVPQTIRPVREPVRFKSWLEQTTSGLTLPAHAGIRHHACTTTAVQQEGFVITLIRSGMHAPYQSVIHGNYFMRAGSNFVPVPHAVLAGMFGKRPTPSIQFMFALGGPEYSPLTGGGATTLGLIITNLGKGIAEDIFLNVSCEAKPTTVEVSFGQLETVWTGRRALGVFFNFITNAGVRLAPGAQFLPVDIRISFNRAFDRNLRLVVTCGASASPPSQFTFELTPDQFATAYQALAQHPGQGSPSSVIRAAFEQIFFASLPGR